MMNRPSLWLAGFRERSRRNSNTQARSASLSSARRVVLSSRNNAATNSAVRELPFSRASRGASELAAFALQGRNDLGYAIRLHGDFDGFCDFIGRGNSTGKVDDSIRDIDVNVHGGDSRLR